MEYNVRSAIAKMQQGEEDGIRYVYTKTYNYVYLRAKSILKREADIQQLMYDVYKKLLESAAGITAENLYERLGECVYRLGCSYYRKKKAREAELLELEESDLEPKKADDPQTASDVIADSLDELPDLYQAVFYAFYYDYMKIEKIAEVMDCTEGVIINSLNYTRKYMIKALELYREENTTQAFFSIEAVCAALRKWSVEHCLGITAAQAVYAQICREAGVQPEQILLEGKEFAGVNHTVVSHKPDDFEPLREQMERYGKKHGPNKTLVGILAGAAAVVVAVTLVFSLSAGTKKSGKKEKEETGQVQQEEEEPEEPADASDGEAKDAALEYIFPDSDKRALTREEVEAHTKEELRIGRNEIYARHGVIFDGDLGEYFSSKSWYKPTISLSDFYNNMEAFTQIEEGNVELILAVEKTK